MRTPRPSSLFPLALSATLAACAATSRSDPRADEQAIRDADKRWVEAVQGKNLDGAVSVYADDSRFMVPNAPEAKGREAIRKSWEELLKLPGVSLTFEPTTIEVAQAGDLAYEVGTYKFGFDGPQGRVEDDGKSIVVWKKVGGDWKVVADIFNSNRAMAAPAPATQPPKK